MNDDENLDLTIEDEEEVNLSIDNDVVKKTVTESNYENLDNKPSINAVTLIGDKSFEDLGLEELTNLELKEIFDL